MLFVSAQAEDLSSGLFIQSHLQSGTQRTGLILNDGEAFDLSGEATVTFEIWVRPEIIFGYVTRIITDTGRNIDLVFSVSETDVRYPSLVVGDVPYPVTADNAEVNCWIPVSIKLSPQDKRIYLTYGSIYKAVSCDFEQAESYQVSFGVCTFDPFASADAAPVNIRDIRVYEKSTLTHHWKLGKHGANCCYDELESTPAAVQNPRWLIDEHTKWTKVYTRQLGLNPQYAFDSQQGIFYIVPGTEGLIQFDVNTLKDTLIHTTGGYPAGNTTSQLVYDFNENRLVSYNLDDKTLSFFLPQTSRWTFPELTQTEHRYFNHTLSWVSKDSTLVTFGGYGYYMYNNLLTRINPRTGEWKQAAIPEIDPRYSPASVVVGNELFIFGGRGCKSGRQDMSPHNYYDLYAINFDTNEARKVLEIQNQEEIERFLPGCNMVYNAEDSLFYVFTEQGGGQLLCFSLSDPVLRSVASPIADLSSSDVLFCNLYYSYVRKKLYALIGRNFKSAPSEVAIYSMNYPPVPAAATEQVAGFSVPTPLWGWVSAGSLLLAGCLLYLFLRQRRKKEEQQQKPTPLSPKPPVHLPEEAADVYEAGEATLEPIFDRTHSCICFFGGFRVVDRNGDDCTGQFTPVLKSLLLLIILYTDKNEKGIPGGKLDELLWGDKTEKSARNNRNVSISKLRGLLEQVGSIQIVCDNNYWKISCSEEVFCDYLVAQALIRQGSSVKTRDENFFQKLLELLFYGSLLPNTQADWLDNFKSDYSSAAIDLLNDLLLSDEIAHDDKMKLRIADTIFLHDILNEEALAIKCHILFSQGKKTLARKAYDNFSKEYKNLLGVEYAIPLTAILHNEAEK